MHHRLTFAVIRERYMKQPFPVGERGVVHAGRTFLGARGKGKGIVVLLFIDENNSICLLMSIK